MRNTPETVKQKSSFTAVFALVGQESSYFTLRNHVSLAQLGQSAEQIADMIDYQAGSCLD